MTLDQWPNWISAIGSLGAVCVALAVALREAILRRRSREDDDRRLARLVVVGEPAIARAERMASDRSLFATVHNYGDFPIRDVIASLQISRGEVDASPQHISIAFLGPGEKQEFEFAVPDGPGEVSSGGLVVHMLDGLGRRWRLTAYQSEPTRLWNYVPPDLSDDIRREIVASQMAHRRARSWLKRLAERL